MPSTPWEPGFWSPTRAIGPHQYSKFHVLVPNKIEITRTHTRISFKRQKLILKLKSSYFFNIFFAGFAVMFLKLMRNTRDFLEVSFGIRFDLYEIPAKRPVPDLCVVVCHKHLGVLCQ